MRAVYVIVVLLGIAAILVDHLSSPSSGRAVSPEDFAGLAHLAERLARRKTSSCHCSCIGVT